MGDEEDRTGRQMPNVDLIVHNAAQVVTCAGHGAPKRGAALADPGIVTGSAIAVDQGRFVEIGPQADVCARYRAATALDAKGRAVVPGLVDCHTHLVFGGDRVGEFEQRVSGAGYLEILQAGGGILSTVCATRETPLERLAADARKRLDTMLAHGTTTVEVKTGYGLDTAGELKMLEAVGVLAGAGETPRHAVDLVPTFLGAHAVPPEYAGRPADYVDLLIADSMPAAMDWYKRSPFATQDEETPFFNDVFCEANVFDRGQSERVLRAGQALGMATKIHADEFVSLGGVGLAVELRATSADDLDVTPAEESGLLAASATIGVLLPAVTFNLGSQRFADARAMIDAGVAVALSTDFNPGSAPCLSLPLVMAIATRYQRLTPAEALNACTINAAFALGLGHRVGSIEAGKQADLLILDSADYRTMSYMLGANPVAQVVKRGRVL